MRFKLISCEVFYREMCGVIARSPHQIDVQFLPKGLHDIGCVNMRERIQAVLDAVDETDYSAVLFGYGLCNNGLAGIEARTIPVVLPRAHDCITLFLGSKERYLDYFQNNPGVYFKTTGWIERGETGKELTQLSIQRREGMDSSYEELVEKYGEDNAQFLFEELCNHKRNYGQFTFIEMGVEPNDTFEAQTRADADARGWKFEKVRGDITMIERLLNGDWNESEFLVVPPGHRVVARYDEGIISFEAIDPAPAEDAS
jgi:hypothetical protein